MFEGVVLLGSNSSPKSITEEIVLLALKIKKSSASTFHFLITHF